jgi:hypothetical protein
MTCVYAETLARYLLTVHQVSTSALLIKHIDISQLITHARVDDSVGIAPNVRLFLGMRTLTFESPQGVLIFSFLLSLLTIHHQHMPAVI